MAQSLILRMGLIAITLAVVPFKLFELDRYFVPKELVLHTTAALVLVFSVRALWRAKTPVVDLTDLLLAGFLVWSTLSALFATNYWLAQRALTLSVSSAILFWGARALGAAGMHHALLGGAALAGVLGAGTALLQVYGVQSDYFSLNRAPGGTFGNRNFVAHYSAIALPALVYCALTARRMLTVRATVVGVALVAGTLVLSRSRAAWLAVAVTVAAVSLPLLMSRRYWDGLPVVRRLLHLGLAAAIGVALAIFIPNRLNWNSQSPYLDSARAVVDYSSGSGRGRVAQYRHSMAMALANPVVGVGPGNWPVEYVEHAPPNDRSLTDDGMTANPWPSSDWVAFVSERGIVAAGALLGVFALVFFGAMRGWSALPDREAVLAKVALIGTITATMVVSAFDAALLLAAPAFLAWTIIGAASGVGRHGRTRSLRRGVSGAGIGLACLLVAMGVARSATQLAAIARVGTGGQRAGWISAAPLDPGSYRISLRVAELQAARGRCATARPAAIQARSLFPHAAAPGRILRQCR